MVVFDGFWLIFFGAHSEITIFSYGLLRLSADFLGMCGVYHFFSGILLGFPKTFSGFEGFFVVV